LYTAPVKAARAGEKCEKVRDFEGVERKKEVRFRHPENNVKPQK
jgi:hypothetical protein